MTAQPLDVPPTIVVATEPTKEQIKAAEEKLAHYHPEHHHFYEPQRHVGKRLLRVVIAGTGVSWFWGRAIVGLACCVCDRTSDSVGPTDGPLTDCAWLSVPSPSTPPPQFLADSYDLFVINM